LIQSYARFPFCCPTAGRLFLLFGFFLALLSQERPAGFLHLSAIPPAFLSNQVLLSNFFALTPAVPAPPFLPPLRQVSCFWEPCVSNLAIFFSFFLSPSETIHLFTLRTFLGVFWAEASDRCSRPSCMPLDPVWVVSFFFFPPS